ncbi:hypothetical protein [Actinoplanes sp. HUAS TT8]|uniref:hypothetical protein n=1 Tax=Actinoplanes sp. HUAS TT8 TaxID=3447453 RepID=UPI003F51B52C
MTGPGRADPEQVAAYHHLLLRAAGRLPDELVATARQWLAAGDVEAVAQAVLFAALAGRVAVTTADADLLAATLRDAGEDPEAVAGLERSETDEQTLYGLAPVGPDILAEHADTIPYSLDLTIAYDGPGGADHIDAAVIGGLDEGRAAGVTVLAVWRAWRFPARHTQWPPARRLYLVQAAAGHDAELVPVAAALQDALATTGETDPQVEVFRDPGLLPAYQSTALGFGALVWAAAPPAELRTARLFDNYTPQDGPSFADDHTVLSEQERDRVLEYLGDGVPLVISPSYTGDILDSARAAAVPVSFHTDGRWIWSGATVYYLAEHQLAPDPELLADIRAADYQPPEVDTVSMHRALARLYANDTAADRN